MPAALELLDDVEEIAPAALDDDLDLLRALRIPGLALDHERAGEIGHREAGPDALPEIGGARSGCRAARAEVADLAHLDPADAQAGRLGLGGNERRIGQIVERGVDGESRRRGRQSEGQQDRRQIAR